MEMAQIFPHAALTIGVVVLLARLNGLRSFSKMSGFDFVTTVAIGSVMASILMNPGDGLAAGLVALTALFLVQGVVARLRARIDGVSHIIDNEPLLIMRDGEILHENLKRAAMTVPDLYAKLREANAIDVSMVRAVVVETTGDISVLHANDSEQTVSPELLQDVRS